MGGIHMVRQQKGLNQPFSQRLFIPSILAFLILIPACAQVTVKKVPTPTQYTVWSDDMQRRADEMEGFRFYLPRPFLHVYESFPIRTDIFLAHGVISPGGQFVHILRVEGNENFRYMISALENMEIPAVSVSGLNALANSSRDPEADVNGDGSNQGSKNESTTKVPVGVESTPTPTPTPKPSGSKIETGINRRATTNDNNAYAVQPLRGSNFDILFLPDFNEQYVISSRSALGNADFKVNFGQGWSLQSFNSLSDNRELNRRIFDLIDDAKKNAKLALASQAGAPMTPVPDIPKPKLEAAIGKDGEDVAKGTPVTLKIVVLHYAAKGVYPVMKPRELQERLKGTTNDVHKHWLYDIFHNRPKLQNTSEFDPDAIQGAKRALPNQRGNSTIPQYPYQYISFNTFRYMSVEAVTTKTSGFGSRYNETGTQKDTKSPTEMKMGGSAGQGGNAGGQEEQRPNPGEKAVLVPVEKIEAAFKSEAERTILRLSFHEKWGRTFNEAVADDRILVLNQLRLTEDGVNTEAIDTKYSNPGKIDPDDNKWTFLKTLKGNSKNEDPNVKNDDIPTPSQDGVYAFRILKKVGNASVNFSESTEYLIVKLKTESGNRTIESKRVRPDGSTITGG